MKIDFYTRNLLKKFEKRRPLYEDFCLAVNKLLIRILEKKKYKYQIYYRVKETSSVREKILRKRKQKGRDKKIYRSLSGIEDLAGVRIIFYLESEKEKFIRDLKKEIPGLYIEELQKENGYMAKHAVIMLDRKKLARNEYKKFKYLKCEIQLISIFNHAWAELEHDWIYKDKHKFKSKNPEKYEVIKSQMEKIFKNYIKKVTYRFESIAKKIPNN